MYRFTRKGTIQNAASLPAAITFTNELTSYLNKAHNLHIKAGMEMFGEMNIHWQFEVDNLDKLSALNQKLLQDKTYWTMVEKVKDLWVPGSIKDEVVNFLG